jgi:hypothetical protein
MQKSRFTKVGVWKQQQFSKQHTSKTSGYSSVKLAYKLEKKSLL